MLCRAVIANPVVGSNLKRLVPQSFVTGVGGMFQAHGARRMMLLLVSEDNARILVTTFFIILLLRAMGGSPIVLVFPVSQICDLTPSLCACRDDCQSGIWRKQYKPTQVNTLVNEPNNTPDPGYGVCGDDPGKAPGSPSWSLVCGYSACIWRGD